MRRRSRIIALATAVGIATLTTTCGRDGSIARSPDESSARRDLHAASGHEPPPEDCTDMTGEGAAATLIQADNRFEPGCVVLAEGQSLLVQNRGAAGHTFTLVDPPGGPNPRHVRIDVEIAAGGEHRTASAEGSLTPATYPFYCRFHVVDGMAGTLVVREAAPD
jgi:plastocyanin